MNFLGPITLEPSGAGFVGSSPPELVSGLTISHANQVTVSFPVTIFDGLLPGTQLVNTAAITSSEVITPVMGSVSLTISDWDDRFFIYLPLVIR